MRQLPGGEGHAHLVMSSCPCRVCKGGLVFCVCVCVHACVCLCECLCTCNISAREPALGVVGFLSKLRPDREG